jgi:hypothetical protein
MAGSEFNTGDPLAYFITWTTYGTWLPGDHRGWNRKDLPGIQPGNPNLERAAKRMMSESSFLMNDRHREIVDQTIRRHCEIRKWHLHAVNPRTNHVHVVVTARGYDPKTVREQFQAWCTRKLKEVVSDRKHFWTEGGSGRFVNTEEELERAIQYVLEAQDLKYLDEILVSPK